MIEVHATLHASAETTSSDDFAEELGELGHFARLVFMGVFVLAAIAASLFVRSELRSREAAAAALSAANDEAERAGTELRSSQQSLSQAQQVAKLSNWRRCFESQRITSWSEELPGMFGIEKGEVATSNDDRLKFVHPGDRDYVQEVYEATSPENASYDIQYRIIRKDGKLRYLREVADPERNAEGTTIAQFGVLQDITEQRLTEDALRNSEKRYRTLCYNTPAMMHSIDTEGRVISVSDQWRKVMGYSIDEVIGRRLTAFMTPASKDYARHVTLPAFFKAGVLKDVEFQFIKKNGEVIDVLLCAISEEDESGQFVRSRAVLTDVTERNRAEARIRRAQRMEAVGQLTGGVAHDFNNLLAGIALAGDLLGERVGKDRKSVDHLDLIRKSVNRGRALTRRLLTFSRQQTLSPIPADVTGLISGLEELLRRTLGENIDLRFELAPDAWPAMIDPHEFESAFVNLVANARDAMPLGGSLAIATNNLVLDENAAKDREDLAAGDYLQVVVQDSGIGMTAEVKERVFEPFFTTKAFGDGSGMGLSTVYGFVKQSSGDILIESAPSKGTTVSMYLPRAMDLPVDRDPDDIGGEVCRGSERILVVEDDPDLRVATVRALRNAGYRIVEAGNGDEAIMALESGRAFELLFTDVVLSGKMNGVELAETAARLCPGIKVLCTTGYTDLDAELEARIENQGGPIYKPYRRDELIGRVRTLLDKGEAV